MNALSIFKEVIKRADFFQTRELLRYKGHTDYRSVFGGVCSILLVFTLLILFYYRLVGCIRKQNISSTEERLIRQTPTPYNIETYPKGNFMFSVMVGHGYNLLTDEVRYFDLRMDQVSQTWDYNLSQWNRTVERIKLERCTKDHWKLLPRMEKQYSSWGFEVMLCPPKDFVFMLEGDQFSDTSRYLNLSVQTCTNDSEYFSNPCAPQQQINNSLNSVEQVDTRIYMVNPNVNPSSEQYIKYTFIYGNILSFTSNTGSYGTIYVQDFQIQTDESIFPVTSTKTQAGATFSTTLYQKTFPRISNESKYCTIKFYKSQISKKYSRSFEKFDSLLAFIGGIFGTLSMVLIIVSSYNDFAYEICLGSSLFKPQDEKQLRTFKKYNFISYLFQITYKFLSFFGCSPNWKTTMEYEKCKREMEKQLDVQYILQRLSFLESATSSLLEEHQRKGIHLKGKLTLKQAKNRRKNFKLKHGIREVRKMVRQSMNSDLSNLTFEFVKKTSSSSDNPAISVSAPKRFSILSNNKVFPTFDLNQKSAVHLQKDCEQSSDSSSDDEKFTEQTQNKENEVLEVLDKLKEESECGNKLSSRIWSATNEVLQHGLSDLIGADQESIQSYNEDSENPRSVQPLIMSEFDSQIDEKNLGDNLSEVNRPMKLASGRQRLSRFSQLTQSSANKIRDSLQVKNVEQGKHEPIHSSNK